MIVLKTRATYTQFKDMEKKYLNKLYLFRSSNFLLNFMLSWILLYDLSQIQTNYLKLNWRFFDSQRERECASNRFVPGVLDVWI